MSVGFDEFVAPDIYYSGNLKSSKFEDDSGMMGWNDNSYFQGEFKKGLREGNGIFISERLEKSECTSKANKLIYIKTS